MTIDYKKIKTMLLALLAGCNLLAQNGPGGVGNTNGASILTHWLDASSVSNVSVTIWPDKSGYNHNATGTGALLKTNEINGQPAVKFNASSRTYYVDGTINNPYTIFSVAKQDGVYNNRLIASDANNWLFGYWGGLEDVWHADGWISYPGQGVTGNPAIYSGTSNGTISSFYKNGNLLASNNGGLSAPSKLRLGGWQDYSENSDGKIAEIIVYSTVLNSVQRILVENYLNAKYNMTIANDKYTQPNAMTYNKDVSGIGKEGNNTNAIASTGGLTISNTSFLQDSGDYILAGYDLMDNSSAVHNDLPMGVARRFARDWYVAVTDLNANNGLIDLDFDLSDAGYNGTPLGTNFKLLFRTTNSGNYTVVDSVATITGDDIVFSNVNTATLNTGYYTLGLPVASPMNITAITTLQTNLDSINAGRLMNDILSVKISTNGDTLATLLNALTLDISGTTQSSDIIRYYLYAGTSSNFANASQIAVSTNINSLTFTATPLSYGDNYFFLAIDANPLATTNNTIDAQCTSVILSTGSLTPSITSPAGYRLIAPANNYCVPYTNGNCCQTGISNFTMNNINNSSTPDNQYSDYTNLVIKAYKYEPIDFSISTRDNMISTIWVDWNKDGVFNTNEQVFHSGVYNYSLKNSFTIPALTIENDSFRLRVGTCYVSQPMNDPCFQQEHTEWEDYTLKVNNSTPMTYVTNYIKQNDTSNVIRGDMNKVMLQLEVVTNGNLNPLHITNFAFNTLGSSNSIKDISNYYLFKGIRDSSFANATLITQANSLGGLSFSPVQLVSGKNYFWLSYDISDTAVFDNNIDAGITDIILDGGIGAVAASTPNPLGKRIVKPCVPILTSNCCNYGINNVSFNYGTGNNTNYDGYTDYSHTIGANTYANDNVHFSVSNNNDQYIAIWVDWNKNRDFENSEIVYTGYNNTTGIFSGDFHVPSFMTSPDTLKIRIATGNNTQPSPCGSEYGEFEDYALFINVSTPMIYDSSAVVQDLANGNTIGNNVEKGSANNIVLGVNVFTHGNLQPVEITKLVFNANGTTDTSDIVKYNLYFGGLDPVFANASLITSTSTLDTFQLASAQLGTGKNYFWLTVDADSNATVGNHLDFECTSVFTNSIMQTPSIQAPAGYYVISSEKYPFGNGVWTAYAFNGYNFDTYRGYYTVGGLDFNSANSWGAGDSPSFAPGYIGSTVGNDNHSVQYKRKGFPKAKYQLDIPGHDDGVTVYINDVAIFDHGGCCDSHTNIWTGVLDSTSRITYAWQEAGGASYGALSFVCSNPTSSDTTATACNNFTWYGNTYTTSVNPTRVIPNTGGCDSTITLHLTINNNTTSDTTATACNNFTWYGNTYTASGTQTLVMPSVTGCDSTITLHLTINNNTTSDTTATACNNFTWYGNTYTTSVNPTRVITNTGGCDSTITLHLTINNNTTSDTTAAACTSFMWHGNTYTASGTQTLVMPSVTGCDSTITLHLTINNNTTSDTTAAACNSFMWHGNTYTASGTQTLVMPSVTGCDSTVTLHLTINNSTTSDTTASACNSFTWYGNTYVASGDQTRLIPSANGCDSTITLHLTINNNATSDTTAAACNSFMWHGNTYTASGTQTLVMSSVTGCDSIITLHLTINTIDLNVALSNNVLSSADAAGNYQWIDCGNNNVAISGETNQSYVVTQPGSYAVVVTNGACSDTSACQNIIVTSNSQISPDVQLSTYPNPTSGIVNILYSGYKSTALIVTITNVNGQQIFSDKYTSYKGTYNNKIDLSSYTHGIYFVNIITDDKTYTQKIIFEK